MPSFSAILVPLGRPLAVPLDRLYRSLDSLGKEVREAIARAIGQAVSEVVREAVRTLLEEPPHAQEGSRWSSSVPVRPPPSWQEREEAYWAGDPYAPEEEDLLYEDNRPEQRYGTAAGESFRSPTELCAAGPRQRPWRRALKAGCLATAWWLRRPPGRFSLLIALTVGLVAGLAALIGGPLAAVGAGAAGSAFVFLGLLDSLHCASLGSTDNRTP